MLDIGGVCFILVDHQHGWPRLWSGSGEEGMVAGIGGGGGGQGAGDGGAKLHKRLQV